jgi:RNA polymerase sigma factor (sigma-70 family)
MMTRPVVQLRDTDVVAIAASVRRYAAAALGDHVDVEDLTQETVGRLIENRWRIDRRTAPGYAIATARSLLVSRSRAVLLAERHQPRLLDLSVEPDPVEVALAAEEESALAAALEQLSARDRDLLMSHHVEGLSAADLAALHSTTPGAIGASLARARGRLRLEYCLQAHRRPLPDQRCRRILTAIATGDGRRQTALGASRHLPTCADCTTLAAAVTAPDRHRAALGILGILAGLFALLRRLVRTHPAVTATGVGVTAAVGAAVLAYSPHHAPPPRVVTAAFTPAAPTSTPPVRAPLTGVISGDLNLLDLPSGRALQSFAGQPVLGRRVPVLAVDADEGFWIGTSSRRIWVELATHGESTLKITKGSRVDFAGSVVANPRGYASRVGVTAAEDAAELDRQGVHLVVPVKDVATVPRPG